ncbi:hypothetical protein CPB86DRAFT_362310 [Serendipita vermifera]|nr:hypothetical protein CPB86DRAFT_362310 [Serendipita vermifera]
MLIRVRRHRHPDTLCCLLISWIATIHSFTGQKPFRTKIQSFIIRGQLRLVELSSPPLTTTRLFAVLSVAAQCFTNMLTSIWICALILFTGAEVACLIIDDMDPAIRYEGDWATKSDCDSGFGCLIFPDSSNNALDGTWHFAKWSDSSHRSFEYNFQGTEITIYGILVFQRDVFSDDGTVYSWNVSLDLSIDGDYKDQYHFTQPTEPPLFVLFNYSTPVLKSSGLSEGIHIARVDLIPPTQFIFDFLVYTPIDDPASGTTFPWEAIPTDRGSMPTLSGSASRTSTRTMPLTSSSSSSQMGTRTS